jgi:carboxypeptidase T
MSVRRAGAVIVSAALAMIGVTGAVGANAANTNPSPRLRPDSPVASPGPHTSSLWEVRVLAPDPAQLRILAERADLLELRRGQDYFVLGDATTVEQLRAWGLQARLERPLPNAPGEHDLSAEARPDADGYPTFYGGYHTVDAHHQHLSDIESAHPDLAKTVTYGKSWKSAQGDGGDSLEVICITKISSGDCALSPDAPKPRSVVIAAMHARELATAEIAWNWIDYLTSSYGKDDAVTALLDSTEVWVAPLTNPDGRRIVENGGDEPLLQRKNANDSAGDSCASPPTASDQSGVDLNRNFSFGWGQRSVLASPCEQEYQGTKAASEPETQALQDLFRSLFADRRGSSPSDAAPADTTGTVITYHSYAGMVLYPWGNTTSPAPNSDKLAALASKMAAFNNYSAGTPGELLYTVAGSFDDFTYGDLGVATFTTELGAQGSSCDGFTPPYSCVTSEYWPQERQALLALAQAAPGPYR